MRVKNNERFFRMIIFVFLLMCSIWMLPEISYGFEKGLPDLNVFDPNISQIIEEFHGVLWQVSDVNFFVQTSKPPPPPPRQENPQANEAQKEEDATAGEKGTPSKQPPPKKRTPPESSSEEKPTEKDDGFFQNIIDKIKSIFGMEEKKKDRMPIPRKTKPKVSIKNPNAVPADSVKKETDKTKKETPTPPKEAKKSEKEPEKTERETPKPPPPEVKKAEAQKTPPPPPKKEEPQSEPATQTTPQPEPTTETDLESGYKYQRDGRRDPFRSLLDTENQEETTRKLDIQSLKLVGIIDFGDSGLKAMFEDKDGDPYLLQEGDSVTDGKVIEVNNKEVIFEVVDIGNQTRTIKIPLEENQKVGE